MRQTIHKVMSKGKDSNSSSEDRQEMLALFHHPQNEFDLKNELLEDLESMEGPREVTPQLMKLFYRTWTVIEKKESAIRFRKRYLNAGMKMAAVLVVGLIAGILATYFISQEEPVYHTAHSPRGSVSELILPDSTVIFLNSGSRIRYTMESEDKVREVFLEGEAWFDVEQENEKSFLVHTPPYDVAVTGTQFNVKAYPSENSVVTTLEEGEVILKSSENVNLFGEAVLKPGEQAILAENSNQLIVRTVETRYYTSWKDNKIIFMNMNLRELIVLLERKFGVDIEVTDKSILDYHCDGTFKNETILEVLQIIQRTLPIEYEVIGQKIKIMSN